MRVDPIAPPPTLTDLQASIDAELNGVLDHLRTIVTSDLPMVGAASTHLLQRRGKLLRPTLLLLANRATGLHDPRAIRFGAVIELIHIATLVHDDSVDHSVLRRGMPTINSLFSHQIAVIMGDFLYSRAVIELVKIRDLEALDVLSRITNEMTIGEMRQLSAHDRLAYTEDEYDALIESKTATLFSGACEVGALLASREHREALRRFGRAVGMAFQITDDLIDYTQPAHVTGKPTGHDLREHKVTLPLIAALRTMESDARRRVERLLETAEPTDEQVATVIADVERAGGLDYTRDRAGAFAAAAEAELSRLPESEGREALRAAVTHVVERRR